MIYSCTIAYARELALYLHFYTSTKRLCQKKRVHQDNTTRDFRLRRCGL